MLFQDRITNIVTHYPRLSSIWIKTGDARTPLKRVWMSESALRELSTAVPAPGVAEDSAELAEDHLCFAA